MKKQKSDIDTVAFDSDMSLSDEVTSTTMKLAKTLKMDVPYDATKRKVSPVIKTFYMKLEYVQKSSIEYVSQLLLHNVAINPKARISLELDKVVRFDLVCVARPEMWIRFTG